MIIHETEKCERINLDIEEDGRLWIESDCEIIVVDKEQAAKLARALQLYVDNGFKNND